jgi:hypothetical protein
LNQWLFSTQVATVGGAAVDMVVDLAPGATYAVHGGFSYYNKVHGDFGRLGF